MTRTLVLCFLLAVITGASVRASKAELVPEVAANLIKARLVLEDSTASSADAAPDASKSCEGVSFSRSLKYGESDQNVLDVATGTTGNSAANSETMPSRPVLVFVAGDSFTGDKVAADVADTLQDAAMCFAARNGMVGIKISYRLAPAHPWPAGARDVAAATSWIRQNADLFGGNPNEIVAVGYSAGAFHVASFLAHPEFQERDSGIAAVVLVSGIYRLNADATDAEKSYFGADTSQYDQRSVFPGILNVDTPILLAWSVMDPPHLIAQGEKLKELLCNSPSHCPHTTLLKNRDGLASIFTLDGGGLAEPTLELIREIQARGLP
jgi:acetyl esterase/lipase